MKISKDQLQQIIKEELEIVLNETAEERSLKHAKFFGKPSMPDVNTSRKWKLAPPASGQGSYTRVPNPDYKPVKTALEKGASKLAPLAKGVGRVASRVAPPVAAAATAYDLYKGFTNPDTYTALSQLFGGEEGAYNTWAAQQAEAGREVPSYEVYKAKESEMGGIGEKPEPQQRYDISDETGAPVLRSDLDDALSSLSKDQLNEAFKRWKKLIK